LSNGTTYGVVFSGGGALGAWEVGAYRRLRSLHGIDPGIVSGASAGALNAVAVSAQMTVDDMQAQWEGLTSKSVYKRNFGAITYLRFAFDTFWYGLPAAASNYLKNNNSVFNNAPLRETLERTFSKLDQKWAESNVRCVFSLTSLPERQIHYFYKLPSGEKLPEELEASNAWTSISEIGGVYSPLMGSTGLPILFPPTANYFDGGVLLNEPILAALKLYRPTILYIITPSLEALLPVGSILEIGSTLLNAWLRMSLDYQIERIKIYNEKRSYDQKLKVCIIRPSHDLTRRYSVSLLDFGKNVRQLVLDGDMAAASKLGRFKDEHESTWYS
jgi:predicted acylesterase/phospholipase RssA